MRSRANNWDLSFQLHHSRLKILAAPQTLYTFMFKHWYDRCLAALAPGIIPLLECHNLGGRSPASHRVGPGSIPGQSMGYLWWTKWHQRRFISEHFGFPLPISFHRCSIFSCIILNWCSKSTCSVCMTWQFHHPQGQRKTKQPKHKLTEASTCQNRLQCSQPAYDWRGDRGRTKRDRYCRHSRGRPDTRQISNEARTSDCNMIKPDTGNVWFWGADQTFYTSSKKKINFTLQYNIQNWPRKLVVYIYRQGWMVVYLFTVSGRWGTEFDPGAVSGTEERASTHTAVRTMSSRHAHCKPRSSFSVCSMRCNNERGATSQS